MSTTLPSLYTELASWWTLVSRPEEYVEEAAFFSQLLRENSASPPRSVLELGSGGGCMASHLKTNFEMTLVDLAPGMLDVSRALNPECEHLQGDMRSVRLGHLFDAVFIHDAIDYITTEDDLKATFMTAAIHCSEGAAAVFAPDYIRENFSPDTDHGGYDGEDRSLRFIEWAFDPDPTDTLYTADFAYVLRQRDGTVRLEHDRHQMGLFPRSTWLRLMEEAGFASRVLRDQWGRDIFVGTKV